MTDRRRLAERGEADCILAQARYAIEATIDFIQIRERDLEAADLASLVSAVVKLARGSRTAVLVNDRVDVAIACGAAGVHLRADSAPPAAVRRIAPKGFVIGQSVHSVDAAVAAAGGGHLDYLIAGTVWPTVSKPDRQALLGVHGLARLCAAVRLPVLAIGGVTPDRVRDIARAGAAGAAGIGLFMAAGAAEATGCRAVSLGCAVDAMRQTFDTSGSPS